MVPVFSAWIVIITRQVVLHVVSLIVFLPQAKHVHYSILVFWFAVGGQVVALVGVFALDPKPLFQVLIDFLFLFALNKLLFPGLGHQGVHPELSHRFCKF